MTEPATQDDTVCSAAITKHARLMVVARADARFCIRIRDASEVGRIIHLTRMDGHHKAFLGTTVLHGCSVPVIDVAAAIGAAPETADMPRMFVAVQTDPAVCIAVDEVLAMRERGEEGAREGPHELVQELVTMDGQSLPVIDVSAVARLVDGAAAPAAEECDRDRIRIT